MRFAVREWAAAGGLGVDTNNIDTSTSYPMFYFTFYNFEDSLTLYLWVGPSVSADVRTKLLQLGEQNAPPFCKPVKEGQYYYIYKLELLHKRDYESKSDEELKTSIGTKWQQFTEQDLPKIREALRISDWFWS